MIISLWYHLKICWNLKLLCFLSDSSCPLPPASCQQINFHFLLVRGGNNLHCQGTTQTVREQDKLSGNNTTLSRNNSTLSGNNTHFQWITTLFQGTTHHCKETTHTFREQHTLSGDNNTLSGKSTHFQGLITNCQGDNCRLSGEVG